uniref:Uncharacterized protein n=1 Tax=Dendroctonus ponderosae TaxID=77166 RepID=A0AAR5QFL3_DENPD
MSGDLRQFFDDQRRDILKEKTRQQVLESVCLEDNKENVENPSLPAEKQKVPSVLEPLDLTRCYKLTLEERKQALIDRLANCDGPFSHRSSDEATGCGVLGSGAPFGLPSFRRGEYAPPSYVHLRAAPHEGLGEYEIRRGLATDRPRSYLRHGAKKGGIKEVPTDRVDLESPKSDRSTNTELSVESKSVQTDIANINCELVVRHESAGQYQTGHEGAVSSRRTATDDLVDLALRRRSAYPHCVDQRLTSAQNEIVLRASSSVSMDKPKSILSNRRTGSPRDRYPSEGGLSSSYTPATYLDGFSYSDRSEDLERERLKREAYQHDLRLQIEEKRHLAAMREEQERRERDLENRRLEQQLMRMREEQFQEEQRRQRRNELMRRHSDDMLRRKTELHEMQRPWRRHADSESANLDSLGLSSGGYAGPGYSPPVSRKTPVSPYSSSYNVPPTSVFPDSSASRYQANRFESSSYPSGILRKPESSALRRMDAASSYDTVPLPRGHRSKFDRFDSLSRIDSLSHRLETMSVRDGYSSDLTDVQRRHSATQQDLSLSRSPRLRRRNSSSRFEESLPVPLLKARSPVAKELRNAIPFSSHRRPEERWQIGAGQKSNLLPSSPVGSRGSILTQLGSIRAQLQREQLRMDETLRRRGLLRTRTTEDY